MITFSEHLILGVDIGGSHISLAFVDPINFHIDNETFIRAKINSKGRKDEILNGWQENIVPFLNHIYPNDLRIAVAMPGPFDYKEGISKIKGLDKYEALYDANIKNFLSDNLKVSIDNIRFRNDAEAFLAGEMFANTYDTSRKTLGITLGTGLGSAISQHGITKDANFAVLPFKDGIAEEHLSTRWFVRRYEEITGKQVKDVLDTVNNAHHEDVEQLFSEFTQNLSAFLRDVWERERFELVLIGGNIAKTADRFLSDLIIYLKSFNQHIEVRLANLGECSAIVGASLLFNNFK